MKPTFSIILPTYDRGYCLWKVTQAVQKQIYPYWELLVMDDGSEDNTKQVVAEFQKDPRIKYHKLKHGGPSSTRNRGLEIARGEIITYVDSDDNPFENYLSTALEFFQKYPQKSFAVCNYNRRLELYDENHKLIDFTEISSAQKIGVTLQDFYHWKVKTCSTGIFHKSGIMKSITWDTNFRMLEDLDFILQLGNNYPEGFIHIPYALFEYPQKYGGDSLCSTISYEDMAKSFEKIYQKHKDDPLMKGQKWYPNRVKKYQRLQRLCEKDKVVPPAYRYFPQHYKP